MTSLVRFIDRGVRLVHHSCNWVLPVPVGTIGIGAAFPFSVITAGMIHGVIQVQGADEAAETVAWSQLSRALGRQYFDVHLGMKDFDDPAASPLARTVDVFPVFDRPGGPEFHVTETARAGGSIVQADGALQGHAFLFNDKDRHDGEVTGGHEGRL